jgi:hypothetical protein
MEIGLQPGADFFDDGSSDSGWEDSEGEVTHAFPEDTKGLGPGGFTHGMRDRNHASSRGRSKERSILTALPPFHQLPKQRSLFDTTMDDDTWLSSLIGKRPERAREVSLRQLSRDSVRIVHNRSNVGTPRGSIRSNTSSTQAAFSGLPKVFQNSNDGSVDMARSERPQGRMRRNTSDSIIAGSVIDAHVRTMRALESLNDSPSGGLSNSESRTFAPSSTMTDFPKFSSFTNDRHITLSPLSTKRAGRNRDNRDRDRPPDLPNYFIRTPYPFTARKEFPKPNSRPRQRRGPDSLDRLDSGYDDDDEDGDGDGDGDSQKEYNDRKGKHVLGLISSRGQYDLRSRLERNEEAQGIVGTRSGSLKEREESSIWLSLQRQHYRQAQDKQHSQGLVKVTISSNLTVTNPIYGRKGKGNAITVDFDDQYFAEQLRDGYRKLSGNWFQRNLSARKLKEIRLGHINTWSGTYSQPSTQATSGLLAAGVGIDMANDTKSPFTETSLMNLYHYPPYGKARYTWVHWAQRVAESNAARSTPSSHHRHARSQDNNPFRFSQPNESSITDKELPETITTIQFVHSFSTLRILTVLMLMLGVSVAAAIIWVIMGPAGTGIRIDEYRERSDRVGSGMAIGILLLLLESLGFGAWLWCS